MSKIGCTLKKNDNNKKKNDVTRMASNRTSKSCSLLKAGQSIAIQEFVIHHRPDVTKIKINNRNTACLLVNIGLKIINERKILIQVDWFLNVQSVLDGLLIL